MQTEPTELTSEIVIQRTQGLAEYLLANVDNGKQRGVVIGGDARHDNKKFLRTATAVLVAMGIKVYEHGGILNHTPLVPFGVKILNAAAGLVITASYKSVRGSEYKVYWSNGCLFLPAVEAGIASCVEQNLGLTSANEDALDDSNLVVRELDHVREAYIRAVAATAMRHQQANLERSTLPFVYDPMDGAGLAILEPVLKELDITGMITVSKQDSSDPDSPTRTVLDLEEKGAQDLAVETADAAGINLILATSPGADRLAVSEKVEERWHKFTSNELGALLAAHLFETYPRDAEHPLDKMAVLVSIVSSKMLRHMCSEKGVFYTEVRPGFEWLGNKALDLEAEGCDVQFAYEDLGYMTPAVVHDKDSIAAAALFLVAAQRWQAQGLTPWAKLQKLYERYGHWAEANTYLISPSVAVTRQIFANLRSSSAYETVGKRQHKGFQWGHRRINWWRDLTGGYESHVPDHKPELPVDESSELISLMSESRIWVTLWAPLATEQKIRIYVNAKGVDEKEAQWRANQMCEAVINEWFQPRKYRLHLAHKERYPF